MTWTGIFESAIGQLIALGAVALAFLIVGIYYFVKDIWGAIHSERQKRRMKRLKHQLSECQE